MNGCLSWDSLGYVDCEFHTVWTERARCLRSVDGSTAVTTEDTAEKLVYIFATKGGGTYVAICFTGWKVCGFIETGASKSIDIVTVVSEMSYK